MSKDELDQESRNRALERLRALMRQPSRPEPKAASERCEEDVAEALPPIEQVLGGEVLSTPFGSCLRIRREFALAEPYGNTVMAELSKQTSEALEWLAGSAGIAALDFDQAVFFDTETTGLAGNSKVVIFLSGLAFVEAGHVVVIQFLMRSPAEERSLLWATHDLLQRFSGIITYNGKAFDVPLLHSRFSAARFDEYRSPPLHLDLLPVARRLWRFKYGSCRLTDLERNLLEFYRDADIPGALIPSVYYDFLRTGEAGRLREVIIHNQYDLMTLAVLTRRAVSLLLEPRDRASGEELYGLGRLCHEQGRFDAADDYLTLAMQQPINPLLYRDAAIRRWLTAKRLSRYRAGLEILNELLSRGGWTEIFALQELAKYCEHRQGDFKTALAHTEAASEALRSHVRSRDYIPSYIDFPSVASLAARKQRLLVKLTRALNQAK